MKLEANTTLRGVTLAFADDVETRSVTLRHGKLERLTTREGMVLLINLLEDIVLPAHAEPEDIELYGDEDDEDLSMYEEVIRVPDCEESVEVQTPGEYLRERGHI
jgi:hypothetical protein